jgi:Zn-dependent protease
MDISNDDVQRALLSLIAFVLSVTVHEFGHAWMATKLGDDLPRSQGRLTLSPLAHIDPIGTIVLPLFMALSPGGMGFAWGKPVQINPKALGRGRLSQRAANALVALAGPAMNFLFAVLVSIVLIVVCQFARLPESLVRAVIRLGVLLNITLLVFNLLPIPPLDGAALLALVWPARYYTAFLAFQRWGFLILLLLVLTPALTVLMTPAELLAGAWVKLLVGFLPA